jgi:molybdopterin-guanine dinucleotide biosynthesis protein A
MFSAAAPLGWTALVLAGGLGSRLGNVDKAAIDIGGRSALDHLLAGLPELVPVVVAGPGRPTRRRVTFAQEWPIHGGPVAGIASGLEAVSTPVTVLLAVDMPWAVDSRGILSLSSRPVTGRRWCQWTVRDSASRCARWSAPAHYARRCGSSASLAGGPYGT